MIELLKHINYKHPLVALSPSIMKTIRLYYRSILSQFRHFNQTYYLGLHYSSSKNSPSDLLLRHDNCYGFNCYIYVEIFLLPLCVNDLYMSQLLYFFLFPGIIFLEQEFTISMQITKKNMHSMLEHQFSLPYIKKFVYFFRRCCLN